MCDSNCTVTFTKHAVNIYSSSGTSISTGWRETNGPRLWCMSIITNRLDMPPLPDVHKNNALQALSEYDLPSVEALIRQFHAAADLTVRDTWLKPIKEGNFASCTGFNYQNAPKACTITGKTLKGHMVQERQGIRSNQPKPNITKCKQPEDNSLPGDTTPSQEIHIKVEHISKFYTDDTGRFPFRSRS